MSRCLLAASVATVPAADRAECVTRPMRIIFYTCAEGPRHCLTKHPIDTATRVTTRLRPAVSLLSLERELSG